MSKDAVGDLAAHRPGRRRLLAAALAAASLVALVAIVAGTAAARSGGRTTVILGSTSVVPDPSCPELPCQAVGSVTGFQVNNGQTRLPFRVPRNGRVVGWSLTLSQPTPKQRSFFNGFFGRPPEARLAILKRVPKTNPPRYKLRRQSPIRVLSPYLGQTVRFRLGKPLPVRRGNIIALTVPTWAPAFSQGLTGKNIWRASRDPGKCTNSTDVRQGEAQERVGRRATYGCRYRTARLLYTATVVED